MLAEAAATLALLGAPADYSGDQVATSPAATLALLGAPADYSGDQVATSPAATLALLGAPADYSGDQVATSPAATLALLGAPADDPGYRFARSLALAGARPAAGRLERRAQERAARRFTAAGLAVTTQPVPVPGLGRSRNVIGVLQRPADCLFVLMAHADTVPPSPGAEDNASGVGTLVAFAPRLAALQPRCDVWLVATGAEERIHTGQADHLGAAALVRRVRRTRPGDLRWALSLDEVGRGRAMWLRSPRRRGLERRIVAAAARTGLDVRWVADAGEGLSDHREFTLAGEVAAQLGVPDNPARHTAADVAGRLTPPTFPRVRALLANLLRDAR